MVLYYSATGNTQFIAKQLARRLEDEAVNLLPRIRKQDFSELHSEKPFVICAPVHVCEPPRFLVAYLMATPLSGSPMVYFVFTSGGFAGISSSVGKLIAKKKGMLYMGCKELKMPRNYPLSKKYPMLSDKENLERLRGAAKEIPGTADCILCGRKMKGGRHVTFAEKLITMPFNPIWNKFRHSTKGFYTTDSCIGCGKCAGLCPLNRITMEKGRPKWEGNCSHCMACLANCPFEAIEYKGRTEGKPKYRIGKYLKRQYM